MRIKYYYDTFFEEADKINLDNFPLEYTTDGTISFETIIGLPPCKLFSTPKRLLNYYEKREEYEVCQKIIDTMDISSGEKITMLSERLRCLAILEYNSLIGLEKRLAGTQDKYITKYINKFIGKVMGNPEIVDILDSQTDKLKK